MGGHIGRPQQEATLGGHSRRPRLGDHNVEASVEGHNERELPVHSRLGMGGHSGRPQWEARVRDHNERPQQEATTGRPRPEGIEAMTGRPHRNVKARFERHRLPLEHDSPSKPYPSDVHTNCQQSTVPTGSGPMQQMQPKVATTTCQSKSEARPAREPCTV